MPTGRIGTLDNRLPAWHRSTMTSSTHDFHPGPDTELDLRRAFGRFGTGVTVVTTRSRIGPLGMTANSFSSVSLDPPLVLWAAATASRRHDAFADAATFCVHILGEDQLDLALHFARTGGGFDTFDWAPDQTGAPALSGCLAVFHCDRFAVHPAGDHSVIMGKVRKVSLQPGDTPGLLFDQGRYGSFALRRP